MASSEVAKAETIIGHLGQTPCLSTIPIELCTQIALYIPLNQLSHLPQLSQASRYQFLFVINDFSFAKTRIERLCNYPDAEVLLKSVDWTSVPLLLRAALICKRNFSSYTLRLFLQDFISVDHLIHGPRPGHDTILRAIKCAATLGRPDWSSDSHFVFFFLATLDALPTLLTLLATTPLDAHTLTKIIDTAARFGSTSIVTHLLPHLHLLKPTTILLNTTHWFLLAAQHGHTSLLTSLLATTPINPSTRGNLAITLAANNGHLEIVQHLLPLVPQSPASLRKAASNGHIDVVRLLLSAHSTTDTTPLRTAAKNGHIEIVKLLLTSPNIDPSTSNNEPLRSAVKNRHIDIVKLLLDTNRVDPAACHNQCLRDAAQSGDVEMVMLLLSTNRVDPRDMDSLPLRLACAYGRVGVVNLLLPLSDVTSCDHFAIRSAAEYGHVDVVSLLLAHPLVNPCANDSQALWSAAANGHKEVVRMLLEDGRVDPGASKNHAVRWAAANGFGDVVRELIGTGKVDVRAEGDFAWKRAVKGGHLEVMALLARYVPELM